MDTAVHFPAWLGDMVMALPFARALCRERPGERIAAVLDPGLAPVLGRAGLPMEAWAFGKKDRAALHRRLRVERPREVILLTNSLGSLWPYLLSGVPARRGLGERWTRVLLTSRAAADPALPQGRRLMALLAGPPPADPMPPLLRLRREGGPPTLFVFPGARYGPAKRWGAERFAAVAATLAGRGWRIVLSGTPAEREECRAVADRLGPGRAEVACDLGLEGLMRRWEVTPDPLALANDSGAMHLAAACGLPTLGIYLSTSAARTPPAFGPCRQLESDIGCRPCFRRQCPHGHHRCRERIAPETVVAELVRLAGDRA